MTAHYSDSQPANTHAARRRSPCVNTAAVPFHADYLRLLRAGSKSSQHAMVRDLIIEEKEQDANAPQADADPNCPVARGDEMMHALFDDLDSESDDVV